MAEVTALFWDVGGVLLSDGWGKHSRRTAAETFGLDWEDFESRHEMIVTAFEIGRVTLEQYLQTTVFYQPRSFSRDEFKGFMLEQSSARMEALSLVERLAQSKKYLLATINNESLELNLFRIQRFGLRNYFTVFFSSCFLGVKKPEETIFRIALRVTQRECKESIFIDDRAPNLECARSCGIHAILYRDATQLQRELEAIGIEI
ncbi:MAG: HAD-IA family hydrolase [Acidobacteriota bacterium]